MVAKSLMEDRELSCTHHQEKSSLYLLRPHVIPTREQAYFVQKEAKYGRRKRAMSSVD